jgi:hypothetical protein
MKKNNGEKMETNAKIIQKEIVASGTQVVNWNRLLRLGGMAALGTVLVGIIEIVITFLPGGNVVSNTVYDWFALFEHNPFMGLRNLGLLNIFFTVLGIPTFFALYSAHRRADQATAALALIISLSGEAIFFATNRAFAMLDISNQYSLAADEIQRSILAAAGQAMLSVGQSHTPGTFIAFFLVEFAGLLMSMVMFNGKIFSKLNAIIGILRFTLMLVFEFCTSFFPALHTVATISVMFGGILSLVWGILTGLKLFQLAQSGE